MSTAASDSSASGATLGDSFIRELAGAGLGGASLDTGGLDTGGLDTSQIWLEGDVLSCACPDCGAPMVIRLWLRLAECGMCGARVELSEEFEQLAQQLLERRERGEAIPTARRGPWSQPKSPGVRPLPILAPPKLAPPKVTPPAPAPTKAEPVPTVVRPAAPPAPTTPPPAPSQTPPPLVAQPVYEMEGEPMVAQLAAPVRPAPPRPAPVPAAPPKAPAASLGTVAPQPATLRAVPYEPRRGMRRRLLRQFIACLVSTLFHMLVIIILGLLYIDRIKQPAVYLEVELKTADGGPKGAVIVPKARDESKGREPISIASMPATIGREVTALPEVRAEPMRLANHLVVAPTTTMLPAQGGGSAAEGTLIGSRGAAVRLKSLFEEGGDEQTEQAVALGLKWLAMHQNPDGSWSLHAFDQTGDCNGQCSHLGSHSDTAATALALLPFLGAGHTHREGEYKTTVELGLQWLVRNQHQKNGFMGEGVGRMYAHGQCAIALCEAYALTRDSKLRGPAQQAIDYIVAAQHGGGGWRYTPGEPGDMSIVGWQLMALRSAQMSDLHVPQEVIAKSNKFLTSVQYNRSVARFGYMPGSDPSETMTAEGMLCRLYAGTRTTDPPLTAAAEFLLMKHPPSMNDTNMYYWYYATQVMHHLGNPRWKRWNDKMKPLLLSLQAKTGHARGSWAPTEFPDSAGGRVYMTALAICTLEVYYRHLPLYNHGALLK